MEELTDKEFLQLFPPVLRPGIAACLRRGYGREKAKALAEFQMHKGAVKKDMRLEDSTEICGFGLAPEKKENSYIKYDPNAVDWMCKPKKSLKLRLSIMYDAVLVFFKMRKRMEW